MRSLFRSSVSWKFFAVGGLILGLAGKPAPVSAASQATDFVANVNAGQEVPAGTSNGSGVAYLNIDGQGRLCVALTVSGLDGQIVASHIHGPADPGVSAAIIFDLKPNGSPINICVGPPTSAQLKDLRAGKWYLNVHTSEVAAGEVRGQILPIKK